MSSHDVGRRRFLGYAALMALAPLAANEAMAQAKPAAKAPPAKAPALPKLPLDNPQAKALAYTENATGVKHAAFKAGSHCANCMLYKGTATQAYGPCTLFPKNTVAAKGWCSAWAKKA